MPFPSFRGISSTCFSAHTIGVSWKRASKSVMSSFPATRTLTQPLRLGGWEVVLSRRFAAGSSRNVPKTRRLGEEGARSNMLKKAGSDFQVGSLHERMQKVEDQIEDLGRQIHARGVSSEVAKLLVKREEGLREVQKYLLCLEILEREEILLKLRQAEGRSLQETSMDYQLDKRSLEQHLDAMTTNASNPGRLIGDSSWSKQLSLRPLVQPLDIANVGPNVETKLGSNHTPAQQKSRSDKKEEARKGLQRVREMGRGSQWEIWPGILVFVCLILAVVFRAHF